MPPEDENTYGYEQDAAPTADGGQSSWHGRIARDGSGRRIMWQEPLNGRGGRWVALNTGTADSRSRERFEDLQNRRDIGRRVRSLAERFIDVNREQRTGGLLDRMQLHGGFQAADLAVPFSDPETLPRLQRLRSLANQVVGANWVPGTSGMANTEREQENIRQRYVTTDNRGPTNLQNYFDLVADVAEQDAAVADMERWLTQHSTLDGWDERWARMREPIRARARAEAERRYRSGPFEGQGVALPSDARPADQAPAGVTQEEWDHMTEEERALFQGEPRVGFNNRPRRIVRDGR